MREFNHRTASTTYRHFFCFLSNQPESDCIYHFPIDLGEAEIRLAPNINRKMVNAISFRLTYQDSEKIYLCAVETAL